MELGNNLDDAINVVMERGKIVRWNPMLIVLGSADPL
jgi:hypothetical protein